MTTAALATLLAALPLHAASSGWTASLGGELRIFRVDDQGYSFYIRCAELVTGNFASRLWKRLTQENQHSYIALARRRDEQWFQPLDKFKLSVQGRDYDGPITTATKDGAARLQTIVAALRVAEATVTVDGKRMTMPTTLAAQALPDAAALGSVCKLD